MVSSNIRAEVNIQKTTEGYEQTKKHLNLEHKCNSSSLTSKHLDVSLGNIQAFFSSLQGVVPEPEGKMEEKGAFWSDAAGPNTLLDRL